jgi:hypothetical protein
VEQGGLKMAEYISKEALLYKFIEGDGDDEFTDGYNFAVNDYREEIKNMPAADVQPVKHGRWVQYNRNGEETYIECTNCCVPSRPRHLQMVTRSGEGLPDYCPNCGARMDGDAE